MGYAKMSGLIFLGVWLYSLGFGDAFLFSDDASTPIDKVQTPVGEIHGFASNVSFHGDDYQVRMFLGIPYAKPPVGELRFMKPQLLTSLSTSPFLAVNFGSMCPQRSGFGPTPSEDCLFLNIYAPVNVENTSSRAVMVWIHGGAFLFGSAASTDGSVLSAYSDVIVVTINYRLGPLGFFTTHNQDAPGNYGLWDQHIAFQWLADNIAAFGGDPGNIMIFGASAGGSGVLYQTLYPGNKGLVKRAAVQSATMLDIDVGYFHAKQNASKQFAEFAGCYGNDSADVLNCLRSINESDIVQITKDYMEIYLAQPGLINSWAPMPDGDFVPEEVIKALTAIEKGNLATPSADVFGSIELLVGNTNMDGILFYQDALSNINRTGNVNDVTYITWEDVYAKVFTGIAENTLKELPASLVLQAIQQEYTQWDDPLNITRLLRTLVDITTDYALTSVSYLAADGHKRLTNTTYVYQFATAPPGPSRFPPEMASETSAGHGDDVTFLFGFPYLFVFGMNESDVGPALWNTSKAMMRMWTNFAKTG